MASQEVPVPTLVESELKQTKGKKAASKVTPTIDLDPETFDEHPLGVLPMEQKLVRASKWAYPLNKS